MNSETSQRLRRRQRFWSDILTIRGRRLMKAIRADRARVAFIDQLRQETLRLKNRTPGSWFDPNQPRVPRGQSGGGRWTDAGRGAEGTILVAARGARTFVVPTSRGSVSVPHHRMVDYQAAVQAANAAVAAARSYDPGWRPRTTSSYATVGGAIAHQQAIRQEATAFISQYLRTHPSFPAFSPLSPAPMGHNGGPPFTPPTVQTLMPGGQPLGRRAPGAGEDAFTVTRSEFDNLVWRLDGHSTIASGPFAYTGRFYILPDRCIFGMRISNRYGLTIDVPAQAGVPDNFRIHFWSGK